MPFIVLKDEGIVESDEYMAMLLSGSTTAA